MLDEPHRKAVFARWSAVAIIATGLLLIVMQLAAQIVIDLELLGKREEIRVPIMLGWLSSSSVQHL
jgi:hypothetical protein